MKRWNLLFSFIVMGSLLAFASGKGELNNAPLKVTVAQIGLKYQLMVNGEPYTIKGAGLEFGDIETFAKAGGNSFKTWRVDNGKRSAKDILDEAHKYGVTVLMGIDMTPERHGMNYGDKAAVAKQKARIKKEVKSIMNHPALLGWIIGNQLNYLSKDTKVWDAVEDVAAMIKKIDGNHITTTALAGFNKSEIDSILPRTQSLDFLSIQMYRDMIRLKELVTNAGYINKPYLVTEWGPVGAWEVEKTSWGAPIEQTSTEKASFFKMVYNKGIANDSLNCMGSYVFLWGQKQETTPTWYGLFTDANLATESIDVMSEIWTGKPLANHTPHIRSVLVDGKRATDNIKLKPGGEYTCVVDAYDLDGDAIEYRSEVLSESRDTKLGGDKESRPDIVLDADVDAINNGIKFYAPNEKGAYRIYVYVVDNKGTSGYVNVPFLVE